MKPPPKTRIPKVHGLTIQLRGAFCQGIGPCRELVWPDGRPVTAGELPTGQAFTIDAETGVVELLDAPPAPTEG